MNVRTMLCVPLVATKEQFHFSESLVKGHMVSQRHRVAVLGDHPDHHGFTFRDTLPVFSIPDLALLQ